MTIFTVFQQPEDRELGSVARIGDTPQRTRKTVPQRGKAGVPCPAPRSPAGCRSASRAAHQPGAWVDGVPLTGLSSIWPVALRRLFDLNDKGMNATRLGRLAVLLGTTAITIQAAGEAAERPNVVLIMADDLGYECLGSSGCLDYQTPELDRLASSGVRFEQFHAQPICTPTRVKLMTGQSNRRNYRRFGLLPRDQITFAQLFRDAGYRTCIAGKWQLGREPDAPRHFGFDEAMLWQHTRPREHDEHDTRYSNPRLEHNGRPVNYDAGEFSTDLLCGFITDFMDRNRDTPFLVYYPMVLAHCPFSPTPDSAAWDPHSLGSTSYKGDPRHFQLLGLRENTLLVFIGDNGTDHPIVTRTSSGKVAGGKGSLTDAGTRVPCVVSWPASIKAGHVVSHAADVSDIFPTFCEAAGIASPAGLQLDGASLLSNLRGGLQPHREAIHIWYARDGGPRGQAFARTAAYKLYDDGRFFHVAADRLEQHDLAHQPLAIDVTALRGRLQHLLDRRSEIPRPAE
jgi:arylsulfatase A